MCDPVSIMMGTSAVVSGVGLIQEHKAAHNRAVKQQEAAKAAGQEQSAQLDLRAIQTQDAASQSILQIDRQARLADGTARVSAGEAGVAGSSVDALLGDIQRQAAEARASTNTNLSNELAQLQEENRGVRANAQNQINSAQFPSSLATGLQIGGNVLDVGSQILIRRTKAKSGS